MKKTLILILTILTLVSTLMVSAYAVDESSVEADLVSKPEVGDEVNSSTIPTIGADTTSVADDTSVEESSVADSSVADSTVAETEEDGNIDINFTTENMSTSLEHMGLGLLGVMIVLSLIAIVVFILNKVFKPQA